MSALSSLARVVRAALVVLLVAGCGGTQSAGGGGTSEEGIWRPQGSKLLAVASGLEGFHVELGRDWAHRGKPLRGVTVVGGELVATAKHRIAAADLAGTTFVATAPDATHVDMRIAAVVRHENPWNDPRSRRQHPRHDYVIEYRDPAGAWVKLCPDDAPGATLVPGSFALGKDQVTNGDYDPSPRRLTFSCRDGVAAKCIDWGYPPWADAGAMVSYFQSCTRMARADYCGNGRSRTVDGTMINYGDLKDPPVARFKPLPGFIPEAVWGPGSGAGSQAAALCLSRTRWSTIRIGRRSPCADLMPDPREQLAAMTNGPRRFCDDISVADWAKEKGALFVNNSRMIDVGLVVWTDGAGRYMSTSRFPWLGKGVDAPGPPGYPTFVSIEGSAYTPTLSAPNKGGLVPLYGFSKTVDGAAWHLTTTEAAPGDGWGDRVLEAYVFGPSAEPPVSTAQRLYLHADGRGAYVTTTEPTPPAGYTKAAELGWLPF